MGSNVRLQAIRLAMWYSLQNISSASVLWSEVSVSRFHRSLAIALQLSFALSFQAFAEGVPSAEEVDRTTDAAQDGSPPLSFAEQQRLMAQLARCWRAPGSGASTVTLRVTFDREGRVTGSSVLRGSGLAVKLATRAIRSPACQPFALPPHKYASWQQLDIVFDASQMSLR